MAKRRGSKSSKPVQQSEAASRNGNGSRQPVKARGPGKQEPAEPDASGSVSADLQPAATTLSPSEIETFRQLLLFKRRELVGNVDHMENEALRKNRSDASGDLSMMPIHMADIGTDNYEQEFTIGLISGERATLKEIDEALDRIRKGTYGICLATGKPISKARLKVKPWAQYCLAHKRRLEEDHRRS